jgi:hypothetical protein
LTPSLPRGTSFVNAIALGLDCAAGTDPTTSQVRDGLVALAQEGLKIPELVPDDRSALYDSVVRAYAADHAEAARKEAAERWFAFLTAEAGKATTPERRAVFDSHLVSAATALGDPLRAVPALSASERDAPEDYNPPARLALVYFRAAKLDHALAAADRALGKVYGPRSIEVQLLKARILFRKGDRVGGQQVIDQALAVAQSLPASQGRDDMIARVRKQQAELAR